MSARAIITPIIYLPDLQENTLLNLKAAAGKGAATTATTVIAVSVKIEDYTLVTFSGTAPGTWSQKLTVSQSDDNKVYNTAILTGSSGTTEGVLKTSDGAASVAWEPLSVSTKVEFKFETKDPKESEYKAVMGLSTDYNDNELYVEGIGSAYLFHAEDGEDKVDYKDLNVVASFLKSKK